MILPFKNIWSYLFGPRLCKIHGDGSMDNLYNPNNFEKWGDQVITSLNIIWKISVYTSPLVILYLYRSEHLERNTLSTPLIKMLAGLGFVVTASLCIRAYGRATNPHYRDFTRILIWALSGSKSSTAVPHRKYDFDFHYWPVDWNSKVVEETKGIDYYKPPNRILRNWKGIPMYVIGEIAIRSFALKIIYPGSISLLQMTINKYLLEGRIKLVEQHNGQRFKVHTRDDNDIDCMFVDKRKATAQGKTLVITSEGNAGFYEIGIMTTPLEAGYSVLGWNHPGFAGSTGQPYPLQERYAMDAVMQFAIHKLGFLPENIVLFGWSIGCYSVAWAAVQYPDIKGVILDATFDDLLPLALARMPSSWNMIVNEVIRGHVDLNIAEILKSYSGPIKFVRRTMDEIICLEDGKLSTNRGNDLLVKVLSHRYPQVFEPEQVKVLRDYLGLLGPALSVFTSKDHPGDSDKNKKVFFLAGKHLVDYQSTHCTPLPVDFFQIPQEVTLDEDFIFT